MNERELIYKVEDVDADRRTWSVMFLNEPLPKAKGREITPGYFVPKDAEPCEWEKKCAWDGMPVEYNEAEQRLKKIKCSDWIEYQGFKFCPNCGRALQQE